MNPLRISILQTAISWENKRENLRRLHEKLETLRGETEIIILPETFSTGFSMNACNLAEPITGETITTLRQWASEYQIAIAGSYFATDGEHCYNRAFFLTPEGATFYYDKRHLFRMGGEDKYFTAGTQRPIISYRGWNILLLVCYDLRFPVWSRNVDCEYDLLIYVANWPMSRRKVWDVLLQARSMENMSYVCGVNRVGTDVHGEAHNGGSVLYSPKGELLASIPDHEDKAITATLDYISLQRIREKFPVWKDADSFSLPIH